MIKSQAISHRRSDSGTSPRADGSITRTVHERLRQAILTGRLRPGQRVVELAIAEQYGVSRAPAREALKLLQQERLLEVVPRRGYVVAPVTTAQVRELFELRRMLESAAAARATRNATPADLDALARLVGDPYAPGDPESYARFLAQNKVFHAGVARLARNARLSRIVEALLDELERLFHLGLDVRDRSEALVQEHRDLVLAMRTGDADEAARVMALQIDNACQMVLEAIMQGALAEANV
jgi:DNA-binding GntR family transcriptional regulator